MKILLLSDIHANYVALSELEDEIDKHDMVICLGDLVGYFCQVNEVLDFVRQKKITCILGNHDSYLLNGYPENINDAVKFGIDYADKVIEADHRNWLKSLELMRAEFISSFSTLFVHGSPWQPLREYLYEDNPNVARLAEFKYDLIAFGHTHRYYLRQIDQSIHINPGSVGKSRDKDTVNYACAASIDLPTFKVNRLIHEYDVNEVITLAKKNQAGEWINRFFGKISSRGE